MSHRFRRVVPAVFATLALLVPAVASGAAVHDGVPEIDVELTSRPAKASASTLPEFHIVFPQAWEATEFDPTFGMGRPDGRRHQGNDLMAPKHSPIYSIADGVVTRIGSGPRSGKHLVVDHGGGWTSWYMHLNNDRPGTDDGRATADQTYAPGISQGSFVNGGGLIGYVGDSGNAEQKGAHTHFELHYRGRAVDPHPFLLAAFRRAERAADLERMARLLARVD